MVVLQPLDGLKVNVEALAISFAHEPAATNSDVDQLTNIRAQVLPHEVDASLGQCCPHGGRVPF